MNWIRFSSLVVALFALQACATHAPEMTGAQKMVTGNGDANWIVIEGALQDGATFTFETVQIDGNGWLVMHPFKNGAPVGEVYVGATYLKDGENRNVEITVDDAPTPGEQFIVMLHRDVNENQVFDFVFVDEHHVVDRAVFEGNMMIARPITSQE